MQRDLGSECFILNSKLSLKIIKTQASEEEERPQAQTGNTEQQKYNLGDVHTKGQEATDHF